MKLIRCAGDFNIFRNLFSGEIFSTDSNGNKFLLKDGVILYRKYDCNEDDVLGFVEYNKKIYEIYSKSRKIDIKGVDEGNVCFVGEDGSKLNKSGLVLRALVSKLYSCEKAGRVLFRERGFPGKYDLKFFLVDLVNGEYVTSSADLRAPKLADDGIYGWSPTERSFYKFNLAFEPVWKWQLSPDIRLNTSGSVRSWTPTEQGDGIFLYLGHSQEAVVEVNGASVRQLLGGLLYCFYQGSGAVKWSREFDSAVEDLLLHGDRLYVAVANRIDVLNAENGQTVASITTDLAAHVSRSAGLEVVSIHIDGPYLYCCHQREPRLLIFDRSSLEQICSLELPGGWCASHFQFKDESTGKLYFNLVLGANGAPDYHRNAVLELHPDELGAPVEPEPSPETHISLKPSPEEPGKEEVWVEIRCPRLDDALRFGELHTQNQAYIQGHTLVGYHCEPNPRFNGVVHFRYSGSEAPAEEVREKLKIMEQRFAKWNDSASVYAGDKSKRLCRLDAQYVE